MQLGGETIFDVQEEGFKLSVLRDDIVLLNGAHHAHIGKLGGGVLATVETGTLLSSIIV